MAYQGKTNWTKDDIVKPDDMNRIEQGVKDAHQSIENISQSLTPESIGAAKQEDLNVHVQDNTKHVTAAERDAWNGKETPDGAQQKANAAESNAKAHANNVAGQAEANAKNDSLPRTGGTITGDLAVTNSLTVASRNIIGEIDNLKQSGADAKNRIAGAVSAKGVPASANDDWPTLEWKIGQIPTPIVNKNMTLTTNVDREQVYSYLVHHIEAQTRIFVSSTYKCSGHLGSNNGQVILQVSNGIGDYLNIAYITSGIGAAYSFAQMGLVIDKDTRKLIWTVYYKERGITDHVYDFPVDYDLNRKLFIYHRVMGGKDYYTGYSFTAMDVQIT